MRLRCVVTFVLCKFGNLKFFVGNILIKGRKGVFALSAEVGKKLLECILLDTFSMSY